MARKGQFQPGQSGNPKGRPPKERALTDLLEKAGNRTYEINGKRIAGKRILSQVLWDLIVYGRAELPGDEKNVVLRVTSAKEWLDIAKQVYSQVDGPPKGDIDLNLTNDVIKVTLLEGDD